MSPNSTFHQNVKTKRSSALIITLVILVLVTLLVVSLTSMIGLERTSTHESFENQRARELANLAVDEVVSLLRDNIPATNIWAAAPGQIEVPNGSGGYTNILLFSGTNTLTTGQVDLNAPLVLGSSTPSYPIIPINNEYPTQTPLPMGWIEVVLNPATGTISYIRPGTASNTDPTKQVVGRFAYWTDTETSKVNINTAGKGQASYYFDPTKLGASTASNDLQNLTGAPSRVDLSQLDGGITAAQSLATYHNTYGGEWLGDKGDIMSTFVFSTLTPDPPGAPWPPVPTYGQGMLRFNSIQEWSKMTNDPLPGVASTLVTPILPSQVETNKFYLTTQSRSPEVTPWGFNKLWLQVSNVQPTPFSTNAFVARLGNKLNAKGPPFFPASTNLVQQYEPGSVHDRGPSATDSDNRYYATPYYKPTSSIAPLDFQFMGQYDESLSIASLFISNMMVQLNRRDWPGFAGSSFVDKYGQAECEDLAYNILWLYDSTIFEGGYGPWFYGSGRPNFDSYGFYGSKAKITVDGTPRLMTGVGEWPYLNRVSATFHVGANGVGWTGFTNLTARPQSPYAQLMSNIVDSGGVTHKIVPSSGTAYYTKFVNRPGFAPYYPTASNWFNVMITPSVQVVYPAGFKNPWPQVQTIQLVDIAVKAKGSFPNSANIVTYGSMAPVDTENNSTTNYANHPYYWTILDNTNTAITTNAGPPIVIATNTYVGGNQFTESFGQPFAQLTGNLYPLSGGNGTNVYTQNIALPDIYIGPFANNTTVSSVEMRCRFVIATANDRSSSCPLEIVPMGYNAYNNGEDYCYQNVMAFPATGPYLPVITNTPPVVNYAPTFDFKAPSQLNINASSYTNTGNLFNCTASYFVSDPRVSRYISDWTPMSGTFTGLPPSYTNSLLDPLTKVTGDDSKFAWPDLSLPYFTYEHYYYTAATTNIAGDVRAYQTANNIQGFPGVGWLSVLPLNIESSVGTPSPGSAGTGSGDASMPNTPIPWRTLSLEASQTTDTTPPVTLPDWLILQAFGIAYDQTFASQTDGKININTLNAAFPNIAPRLKPLQALIRPTSYAPSADNPDVSTALTSITNAIAAGPSGSTYTSLAGSTLPSDLYMYPEQLCQVGAMGASGADQWRRESLMRNIVSTLTTQSSDFKVHVVAQAVKQVAFTGNPTTDLQVTGEQRMSAIVSRVTNLGPDNIPDSVPPDEPSFSSSVTLAPNNGTLPFSSSSGIGNITNSLLVTTPNFKYVISGVTYYNN